MEAKGKPGFVLFIPKNLKRTLQKALTKGMHSILLCNMEGSLIAKASAEAAANVST